MVSSLLSEANSFGGKYTKKAETVVANMKKIEELLYELSMQRMGGRAVSTLRMHSQPPPAGKEDGDGTEQVGSD